MRDLTFCALVLFGFLVPGFAGLAATQDLHGEIYQAVVRSLSTTREAIAREGPIPVKAFDASVSLENGGADDAVAIATRVDGRPIIIFPRMFSEQLAGLAHFAIAAFGVPELFSCNFDYKERLQFSGSYVSPREFVLSAGEKCRDMERRLALDVNQLALAKREAAASASFVYLHELGHLYHGHSFPPLAPDTKTTQGRCQFAEAMKAMRDQEYEADKFAVRTMFEIGLQEQLIQMQSIWYMAWTRGPMGQKNTDIFFYELASDHPNLLFRHLQVLLEFESRTPSERRNPQLSKAIAEFSSLVEKVKIQAPAAKVDESCK